MEVILEEDYIYQLEKTIEYSKDGEFVKTGEIRFRPPDMSVFDESTDFEQIMMGSIMSASVTRRSYQCLTSFSENPNDFIISLGENSVFFQSNQFLYEFSCPSTG